LALRLSELGADVVVMEAGGRAPDPEGQLLYAATERSYPLRLHKTRLRQLGGTSGHWAGYCAPLDPEDFEREAWGTHSGWPISYASLGPYYKEASGILDLPRPFLTGERAGIAVSTPLEDFEAKIWQISAPTRFARKFEQPLEESSRVRVILGSPLTRLIHRKGRIAQSVHRSAEGELQVRAKVFVLAMGAIENARMLLIAKDRERMPVGEKSGLLGRCFMEHPHFMGAARIVVTGDGVDWIKGQYVEQEAGNTRLFFRLAPEVRRRLSLASVVLRLNRFGRASDAFLSGASPLLERLFRKTKVRNIHLMGEQLPVRENGIQLSAQTDALGLNVIESKWTLSKLDRFSYLQTLERFARSAGQAGLGIVRIDPRLDKRMPAQGAHHMGTVRMARSAEDGVVDSDCRVFEVENLYVAGSAVFPITGCANPTLTIVALALRLGDHLASNVLA
jgi:choline dehydrogenase-like flavoprotein